MGIWNSITSIFGKKKEEEKMQEERIIKEESRKVGRVNSEWIPIQAVAKKVKNTNKKFVTYSIRKYLGSKANTRRVEKAGFKTLNTTNKFSDYVLSARISLKHKVPVQLFKTDMGFPVRFPLVTDLINILDYSVKSYKGK